MVLLQTHQTVLCKCLGLDTYNYLKVACVRVLLAEEVYWDYLRRNGTTHQYFHKTSAQCVLQTLLIVVVQMNYFVAHSIFIYSYSYTVNQWYSKISTVSFINLVEPFFHNNYNSLVERSFIIGCRVVRFIVFCCSINFLIQVLFFLTNVSKTKPALCHWFRGWFLLYFSMHDLFTG